MKKFLLIVSLLLAPVPVLAQDKNAPPITAEEQERLDLAVKMHDIWPIRTRMEAALDAVAENFPEDRRAEIKATMRHSIEFDELEEESIKAMAGTFTADELRAMIDFYGSDIGKSISAKTADYELALRPVMTKMMDKAMLDLRTGQ